MTKEEFIDLKMKLSKEDIIYDYYATEEKLIEKLGIEHENYELKQENKKQKEVIDKLNLIIKGIAYGGNEDYYMEKFSKINELLNKVSE